MFRNTVKKRKKDKQEAKWSAEHFNKWIGINVALTLLIWMTICVFFIFLILLLSVTTFVFIMVPGAPTMLCLLRSTSTPVSSLSHTPKTWSMFPQKPSFITLFLFSLSLLFYDVVSLKPWPDLPFPQKAILYPHFRIHPQPYPFFEVDT